MFTATTVTSKFVSIPPSEGGIVKEKSYSERGILNTFKTKQSWHFLGEGEGGTKGQPLISIDANISVRLLFLEDNCSETQKVVKC